MLTIILSKLLNFGGVTYNGNQVVICVPENELTFVAIRLYRQALQVRAVAFVTSTRKAL